MKCLGVQELEIRQSAENEVKISIKKTSEITNEISERNLNQNQDKQSRHRPADSPEISEKTKSAGQRASINNLRLGMRAYVHSILSHTQR